MYCGSCLIWASSFIYKFLRNAIVFVLRYQLNALNNHGLSLGVKTGNQDVYGIRVRIERVLLILAQ